MSVGSKYMSESSTGRSGFMSVHCGRRGPRTCLGYARMASEGGQVATTIVVAPKVRKWKMAMVTQIDLRRRACRGFGADCRREMCPGAAGFFACSLIAGHVGQLLNESSHVFSQ